MSSWNILEIGKKFNKLNGITRLFFTSTSGQFSWHTWGFRLSPPSFLLTLHKVITCQLQGKQILQIESWNSVRYPWTARRCHHSWWEWTKLHSSCQIHSTWRVWTVPLTQKRTKLPWVLLQTCDMDNTISQTHVEKFGRNKSNLGEQHPTTTYFKRSILAGSPRSQNDPTVQQESTRAHIYLGGSYRLVDG